MKVLIWRIVALTLFLLFGALSVYAKLKAVFVLSIIGIIIMLFEWLMDDEDFIMIVCWVGSALLLIYSIGFSIEYVLNAFF